VRPFVLAQKIRSTLLQHVPPKQGCWFGKARQGGVLGTVQRPCLSLEVQRLRRTEDPALLVASCVAPPRQFTGLMAKRERAGAQGDEHLKPPPAWESATGKQVLSAAQLPGMKGWPRRSHSSSRPTEPLEKTSCARSWKGLLQGLKQEGLRVIHLDCWSGESRS